MGKNVIVISGAPGAGSSTVSKIVARKLHLKYFSFGELHKGLVKGWKNEQSKAALDAWKTLQGSSEKTHKNRDALQESIAKKGNIVICGKLSIHFLKDITNKKIWLDVSLEARAKRASKRDRISVETAMKEISERENIERESWKKIYGFDYFGQKKDADLAIDSSNMTVYQTVKKIIDFIKSK